MVPVGSGRIRWDPIRSGRAPAGRIWARVEGGGRPVATRAGGSAERLASKWEGAVRGGNRWRLVATDLRVRRELRVRLGARQLGRDRVDLRLVAVLGIVLRGELGDDGLLTLRIDVRQPLGALELRLAKARGASREEDVVGLGDVRTEEALLRLARLLLPLPPLLLGDLCRVRQPGEDARRRPGGRLGLRYDALREGVDGGLEGARLLLGLALLHLALRLALERERRVVGQPLRR